MEPLELFTTIIYATLLAEIVFWPIPSVASTYQLLFAHDELHDQKNAIYRVRRWSIWQKVTLLVLPTGVGAVGFSLPLVIAWWDGVARWLTPAPIGNVVVGVAAVVFGRILTLLTTYRLRAVTTDQPFALRTDSLFRHSRNPSLLGLYATFGGFCLIYPYWQLPLALLWLAVNMHMRVKLEEAYLCWKFGRSYATFMSQTRRYL